MKRLFLISLAACILANCGGVGDTPSSTNNAFAAVFSTPDPVIVQINEDLLLDTGDYLSDASQIFITAAGIPGMSINGQDLIGRPSESGVFEIELDALHSSGVRSDARIILVVEAAESDLPLPVLPGSHDDFEALRADIPAHFTNTVTGFDRVSDADNTPIDNQIDNATATLGRVLFYDKRLSANNTISCATCHQQALGFADARPLSLGFKGEETGRHAQALSNNVYYERGHYFWDERADTLEDQVLLPIQSDVEMGMTLPALVSKLEATVFYPDLFADAFGDADIDQGRIAQALAQFVRSMLSYDAGFDAVFDASGNPNFSALTASERRGLQLFSGNAGITGRNLRCDACHMTVSQISDTVHNIGLDVVDSDVGAGNGRFKAPSLRNVAVRQSFMHDGRFSTLREVILHYSHGVQDNPNLDNRLRGRGGRPIRPRLSEQEISDLMNFLESLTDDTALNRSLHSDPFSGSSTVLMGVN